MADTSHAKLAGTRQAKLGGTGLADLVSADDEIMNAGQSASILIIHYLFQKSCV